MKSFWCAALCLLLALEVARGHTLEERKQQVKECADEHHVKITEVQKFFDDKAASKDVKCFMKCVLEQHEVLKEDGSFDMSAIKDSSHEQEADLLPFAEECVKTAEKNDDLCEVAYQHNLCMLEKAPEEKFKNQVLEFLEKI